MTREDETPPAGMELPSRLTQEWAQGLTDKELIAAVTEARAEHEVALGGPRSAEIDAARKRLRKLQDEWARRKLVKVGEFSGSDVGDLLRALHQAREDSDARRQVEDLHRLLSEAMACIEYQRHLLNVYTDKREAKYKALCAIVKWLTDEAATL